MSIFKVQNINTILLKFLDIDDLRSLYQVNTYYRNLIHSLLKPFFDFYTKYNKIPTPDWIIHDKKLSKAAYYGNFNVCQYIYKKHYVKINSDIQCLNELFELSCIGGNVKIAKLLYFLGVNICCNLDWPFNIACEKGHIELVKWMCTINYRYKVEIIYGKITDWKIKN